MSREVTRILNNEATERGFFVDIIFALSVWHR